MSLISYNQSLMPNRVVGDFMDIFEFFDPMSRASRVTDVRSYMKDGKTPQTSVESLEGKDVISMAIPGARREGLNIEVTENKVLYVSYDLEPDSKTRPQPFGMSFSRGRTLASDCDLENVSAAYKDGILTIEVPKVAKAKPRRIEIG
tara:strand:+ start:774 stop:1214 length:441 start_codon:yes stop_codon:yes gene_type:complete